MSCDDHSFHATKSLGSTKLFLILAYGFVQCHLIEVKVYLHGFTVIIQFKVYIRKLPYKNCLYPNNL